MRKLPVVLIGLMGAGKTSVGTLVAAELGRALRDSDQDLRAAYSLSAAELVDRYGADHLHDLEAAQVLAALDERPPAVVCAAASVIERAECRHRLSYDAFTVWLTAPVAVLAERFDAQSHRPRFDPDIRAMLTAQAARRGPLFASVAVLTVDVSTRKAVEAARIVLEEYR